MLAEGSQGNAQNYREMMLQPTPTYREGAMNKQLQKFARDTLKEGLSQLPDNQKLTFKRMYSHKNLELPINDVVDQMEPEKLDWAMQQVQRSLDMKPKPETPDAP